MKTPNIALRLSGTAIGVVVGLMCGADWSAAPQFRSSKRWLPAASQLLVAAETRSAAPVLSSSTKEAEAPLVDGWLRRMREGTFEHGLTQILNHPAPMLRHRWLTVLFSRWAQSSTMDAIKNAMKIESPSLRALSLRATMNEWAKNDPVAAWRFSNDFDDPAILAPLGEYTISVVSQRAPALTAAWATSLRDPFARRRAVANVASAWARADLPECASWADSLNDHALRRAAKGAVIEAMARSLHPAMACDEAMSEEDPASRRDLLTIALRVGEFWGPREIRAWLLDNRINLNTSMQSCFRSLGDVMANDPGRYSSLMWIAREAVTEQPLRDAMLSGAALRLLTLGNSALANHLMASVGNGVEREDVLGAQRTRR